MRAELVIAAVLMSACSVVTMERPRGSYRPETTPRCTSNWRPMALDGLGVVGFAVTAAILEDKSDGRAAETGAVFAALLAASAVYGWVQRGRCRDAFAGHDRYLRLRAEALQRDAAPGVEAPP